MTKKLIFLGLILFSFCAPKEKLKVEAPVPEFEPKVAEADILRQKGCYVALKQAFKIYSDAL